MHAIRGHVRLFPLLFLLALLPTILVPLLGTVPVYNPVQPSVLIPPLIGIGTLLLLWMLPTPSAVLFSSLLLAGSTANILHAHIAPVPDYLPLPWDQYHYLNAADVAMLLAFCAVPWVLRAAWQRYWR